MKKNHFPASFRTLFLISSIMFGVYGTNVHASTLPGKTFTSSNRFITTMVSDDRYLWGGTCSDGLIRVDINSGETVLYTLSDSSLPHQCVRELAYDKQGALLVGTAQGGIVRFTADGGERLPGLPESNVLGMTVDNQGAIWAWMQNLGIVRFDGSMWQPIVNRFSGELTSDPAGDVWMLNLPIDASSGCSDGWIHEYRNGGLQTTISLAPVCSMLEYPTLLAVDNKKNCWIAIYDTLVRLAGHSVDLFPVNDDTVSRCLTAIAANASGLLLLARTNYATHSSEIFLYDQVNGTEQPFDSSVYTFTNGYIAAAYADKMSGFWCTASDGTILHIDQFKKTSTFKTGNSVLPSNSIASLLIDKSDNVWAATSHGVVRFDNSQWTIYPAAGDTMPGSDVSALAMDSSGTIWAGFQQPLMSSMMSTGLAYFREQRWHQVMRDHFSVKTIAVDKLGDQWVVSENGVYRYHEKTGEQLFTTLWSSDAGIALGTSVNTIAFDSGNTPWIGTGLGIKRYVNNTWIDDTTLNRYLPKVEGSGLPAGVGVNVICFYDDVTWIGTANGLFKCTGGICEHFDTTGAILPDRTVQCIAVDTPNSVWIGTKRGLVHLNGMNHTTYTKDNSKLYENDITALAVARSGDVWVGTRLGGLTVLQLSGTTAVPGSASIVKRTMQPVEISYGVILHRSCRIAIRTKSSCAIGFSLISLQGRLIRRWNAMSSGASGVTLTWDGTDRFERPVPAGMYLGVVTDNGKIIGSKMLPW